MPIIQIPEELKKQAVEFKAKQEMLRTANAEPLPGPLASAFVPGTTTVPTESGDLHVRKLVASDWGRLKAINSPLLALMNGATNGSTPELTQEDEWDLVWLFTHTVAECRSVLEKGPDELRKRSRDEVGDRLTPPEISLVQGIVLAKIGQSWQTAVKYASELEEKGEVHFFRVPEGTPRTGSDGSSTTKQDSPGPSAGH